MTYNDFKVLRKLGKGGNAIVQVVEDPSHVEYALKKLNENKKHKIRREKEQRFINEICILKNWANKIEGIMPIIKFSKREYWYTMPIAKPVIEHIKDKHLSLNIIIEYFIGLCYTMSKLHKNDVSHRDIKPDNIYFFNNRFYIGDFGLVDFPDNNNNLTRSDRGLGAIFTIAPEMKRDPKHADGKKPMCILWPKHYGCYYR